MRKLLVTIVQLLDGTPAVYGKRQSGQSVVELALITPILIVLLAGLIEIGWFANNYLTLLDVTRAGARRGAVLQDQKSPLFFDNKYSYVPNSLLALFPQYQMPPADVNDTDNQRFEFRWYPDSSVAGSQGQEPCDPDFTDRVFYNEVLCTMIVSMEPLALNPANGIDDIIVSGVSLQRVDATNRPDWLAASFDTTIPQMVVAGRYPTNANECDVLEAGGLPVLASRPGDENRDPFDFNGSGDRDVQPPSGDVIDGNNDFTELEGYDPVGGTAALREKQVGFSLFGNHKIDGTFCLGSEWTLSEIEALMNLPSYGLTTTVMKNCLPSQGLVLVELYWEHEMLLKIPVLSPVFTAVGNQDGKMVINVWAAFPLASVEPHILFPDPTGGMHTPLGCDV